MQFTITTKALRRVCDSLLGGTRVLPKAPMPVLNTAKVEADDGGVTFVHTDLVTHSTVRESAAVSQNGSMLIAVSELVLLAAMKGVKAFLFIHDAKHKTLRVVPERDDDIDFRYDTRSPIQVGDFPALWKLDGAKQSTFPRDKVATLFSSALRCASKDETRPHLAAVMVENVQRDGGWTLRTVATDGHRLAVYEWDHKEQTETFKALVPAGAVKHIIGAWRKRRAGDDDKSVTVECGHQHFRIYDPSFAVGVKLVDAAFPSYAQVIPAITPSAASFSVGTSNLRAVIGAAVAFRSQRDQPASLWFDAGERAAQRVVVSVELQGGGLGFEESRTLAARIPAKYEDDAPNDPTTVKFNAAYMRDVASVVSTDSVRIYVFESLSPILVVENRDDGVRAKHVVMPCRAFDGDRKPSW